MGEPRHSRLGAIVYFCASIVFLLFAIAGVAWVLAAPSGVDDQSVRATFAGWGLSICSLVLSLITAAVGLTKRRSSTAGSSEVNVGDVSGGQQNISGHGTGNIGGVHFHGDTRRGDRS